MKHYLILTLILSLSLTVGCRDNEETTEKKIIGVWKLTEAKISNGGSSTWTPVIDGYTIMLNDNGTYQTTQIPECNSGTYNIDKNNIISFVNSCGNTTIPNSYKIVSFEENILILNGTFCIEDCNEKFSRIIQ